MNCFSLNDYKGKRKSQIPCVVQPGQLAVNNKSFLSSPTSLTKSHQVPHSPLLISSKPIKNDVPTRHVALHPKAYPSIGDGELFEKIKMCGEIRSIYPYLSLDVTIYSFYSLVDAQRCYEWVSNMLCSGEEKKKAFYFNPSYLNKKMDERFFISCTAPSLVDLNIFDYLGFLSSLGTIHSFSDTTLTSTTKIINIEYHDERTFENIYFLMNGAIINNITFKLIKSTNNHTFCPSSSTIPFGAFDNKHVIQLDFFPWNTFFTESSSANALSKNSSFAVQRPTIIPSSTINNQPTSQELPDTPVPSPTTSLNANTSSGWRKSIDSCNSELTSSTVGSLEFESEKASNNSNDGYKKEYVASNIINGTDLRTTFMIKNIPNKYRQQMLIDDINKTHKYEYDFIYLRMDFNNDCNVGYAFINFIHPKSALLFADVKVGKKWSHFNSDKKCELTYAKIQGKSALVQKFKNSHVMEQPQDYRPRIFYSSGLMRGEEQAFPGQSETVSSSCTSVKVNRIVTEKPGSQKRSCQTKRSAKI